jgi:hypothetical protein
MDEAKLSDLAGRIIGALTSIRNTAKDAPEVLEHFAYVLERISECYDTNKTSYGVLLVRGDGMLKLLSIRCDAADVLATLDEARQLVHFDVCADAPPKEMFN